MKHVKLLRNFVYVILERRFVSGWVIYSFKFCYFLTKSDFLTMHVVYLSIQFSENSCDSCLYKRAILYQSLVVSIETKKK